MPQLIKKIIYVSAYVPTDGQSLKDVYETQLGDLVYDKESKSIKLGVQLSVEDLITASFDDCTEAIKNQVRQMAVSEPIQPSLDPLRLSRDRYGSVPKAYVTSTKDKVVPPTLQKQMIKANGISEVYVMDTGHAPFCANPNVFAKTVKESLEKIK